MRSDSPYGVFLCAYPHRAWDSSHRIIIAVHDGEVRIPRAEPINARVRVLRTRLMRVYVRGISARFI